jgi:hypothetical protein
MIKSGQGIMVSLDLSLSLSHSLSIKHGGADNALNNKLRACKQI